jgi:hypothetical protein
MFLNPNQDLLLDQSDKDNPLNWLVRKGVTLIATNSFCVALNSLLLSHNQLSVFLSSKCGYHQIGSPGKHIHLHFIFSSHLIHFMLKVVSRNCKKHPLLKVVDGKKCPPMSSSLSEL